jgi:hypothetical protein
MHSDLSNEEGPLADIGEFLTSVGVQGAVGFEKALQKELIRQ